MRRIAIRDLVSYNDKHNDKVKQFVESCLYLESVLKPWIENSGLDFGGKSTVIGQVEQEAVDSGLNFHFITDITGTFFHPLIHFTIDVEISATIWTGKEHPNFQDSLSVDFLVNTNDDEMKELLLSSLGGSRWAYLDYPPELSFEKMGSDLKAILESEKITKWIETIINIFDKRYEVNKIFFMDLK